MANYVEYTLDAPGKDLTPYAVGSFAGEEVAPDTRSYPSPDNFKGSPDALYHNEGDGTFADVTVQAGVFNPDGKGMGLVCGDYDNDGDMDLFVANDQTANFLYQNNGDGTFADVALIAGVGYSGDGRMEASMGADFGDYDNDGFLDLVVPNFSASLPASIGTKAMACSRTNRRLRVSGAIRSPMSAGASPSSTMTTMVCWISSSPTVILWTM